MKSPTHPSLKTALILAIAFLLCGGETHSNTPETTPSKATDKDYEISIDSNSPEASALLEKIITPIATQAAGKFKDYENRDDLPMNIHDPQVDCSEHNESLQEYGERIIQSVTEIRDMAIANNNQLSLWGKVKGVNSLRLLFQYAILKRPFTPGYCLDEFEKDFFPRLESLVDDTIEPTPSDSP
ncbi:MAG: hypothetical protein KKG47_15615 [Proteobacteria bacterium]|nr:hypothetical protein [Pseudomonadota bacterium]MBU1736816.1 hypothetical protein [Pseudomonadota bacterium]